MATSPAKQPLPVIDASGLPVPDPHVELAPNEPAIRQVSGPHGTSARIPVHESPGCKLASGAIELNRPTYAVSQAMRQGSVA